MKQINVKKLLLPNLPYVFIALFATKLGQAARLAPGADFSQKALHIMEGFAAAFQSALPSFHPIDLCVGVAAALLIRLAVYVKGKNARKFRKNIEYGSARWGNAEDIKPYVDPTFANNVILTQTERLTMNSRPKDPKTARNKNVLVVGPRSELGVREVRAGDVNLISVAELDTPMRVTAKTHYRQRAQAAEAVVEGGQLVVRFDEAVARPAAGQSLVIYDGDAVVGGGTIEVSE